MKTCKTCGIAKPLEEFPVRKFQSGNSGLRPHCKPCVNDAGRDAAREHMRRYRGNNPEKALENVRRWKRENPERSKEINNASAKKRRREQPGYKTPEQRNLERQASRLIKCWVDVSTMLVGLGGQVCWLWNRPGLTVSQRYALKYKLDTDFRASEILRNYSKRKKFARCTPVWADHKAIHSVYAKAARMRDAGHDVQVDHIVPIMGETVCGLHVHSNLRIVSSEINMAKGNCFGDEILAIL